MEQFIINGSHVYNKWYSGLLSKWNWIY